MVNKCYGCGKSRGRWPKDRRYDPRLYYCTDTCKVITKLNNSVDRRTDPAIWRAVMKRDHWTCRYCGDKAEQVDHITPYSKGGKSEMYNLVASCKWCNAKARDRVFDSFVAKRDWLRAIQKLPPVIERKEPKKKKLGWQAWVYGGMKSLKKRRQK